MIRERLANLLYKLADAVGGIETQARREIESRAMDVLARLSAGAERRVESADKEAERRDKMGLLDAEVPDRWKSWYYMRQGYRVSEDAGATLRHWRGGSPQHDGAKCPVCRKPLLLFWDIDCRDPRFQSESPELFGGLQRLPLYYCCRRPEPTVYQVLSDDRIKTIRPDLRADEESPFAGFPDEFQRQPLDLEPIPRDVANLLIVADEFAFDWLNSQERQRLSDYLGDRISSIWDIHLSQFGGRPVLTQGHREISCPNPACATHKMGHPMLRNEKEFALKELAVIDVDAGFEMEANYAQIAFHICWKCHTVHARYRCS